MEIPRDFPGTDLSLMGQFGMNSERIKFQQMPYQSVDIGLCKNS